MNVKSAETGKSRLRNFLGRQSTIAGRGATPLLSGGGQVLRGQRQTNARPEDAEHEAQWQLSISGRSTDKVSAPCASSGRAPCRSASWLSKSCPKQRLAIRHATAEFLMAYWIVRACCISSCACRPLAAANCGSRMVRRTACTYRVAGSESLHIAALGDVHPPGGSVGQRQQRIHRIVAAPRTSTTCPPKCAIATVVAR